MGEAKRKRQIAGQCYLCGGSGLTKQHVWPDWAADYLQTPENFTYISRGHIRPVDLDGSTAIRTTRTGKKRQGQTNQVKLRNFCSECNTKWMRNIEEAARPFAEPLMKGEPLTLDERAQTVLARWLSLVLIVVESGAAESASIPIEVIRKFREDGQASHIRN